ncbi:MAG: hypothetical protein QXS76_02660 [Candidatus Bathyarchaeia archaeon]
MTLKVKPYGTQVVLKDCKRGRLRFHYGVQLDWLIRGSVRTWPKEVAHADRWRCSKGRNLRAEVSLKELERLTSKPFNELSIDER